MTTHRFLYGTLLACACVAGCGSDSGQVTSQTSNYEVGDETSEGSPSESPKPPTAVATSEAPMQSGTAADRDTPPARPTPGGGSPVASSEPPKAAQLPATPEEATPEQLMMIIERLRNQELQRAPQAQQIAEFRELRQSILLAAETLLKKATNDEEIGFAISAKLSALDDLRSAQVPGIRDKEFAFAEELSADKRPQVAEFGEKIYFQTLLSSFGAGEIKEPTEIVEAFKELTVIKEGDASALRFAPQVADQLFSRGNMKAGVDLLRFTADRFTENTDPAVQEEANGLRERAHISESDFIGAARTALDGDEQAIADFSTKLAELVKPESTGPTTLQFLAQIANQLETLDPDLAATVYTTIEARFANHSNKDLADVTKQLIEKYQESIALIGEPFEFEGLLADGSTFDWKSYRGKVVLVDFWATWCGPCLAEMPNIKATYAHYKEHGFEVVGVSIDKERSDFDEFMKLQPLPWPTVLSADPENVGWNHPMATKYEVQGIPFLVLVDREGNVAALNTRGPRLARELAKHFPDAPPLPPENEEGAAKPVGDKPAEDGDKPAEPATENAADGEASKEAPSEKAAEKPPAAEKSPAEEKADDEAKPAEEKADETSQLPAANTRTFFVALTGDEDEKAEDAAEEETLDLSNVNPYSPSKRLSRSQLVDFIFSMEEKPKSIQGRKGFAEAIVEAADRILAANEKDKYDAIAVIAKLQALHKKASDGDEKADVALMKCVGEIKDDSRAKIARAIAFYQLEASVLDTEKHSQEELREALTRVSEFVKEAKLDQQHLRLASSTVGTINRLKDAEEREKYFKEFGGTFAKSRDKDLASYGKRVAGTSARRVTDLVGKPLKLEGTTALGTAFDWESYRGRVVIIDFWATWCGPCRREMPNVKALLETHQERGLDVVAVSLDRDSKVLAEYLEEQQVPWTNLVGSDALALAKQHGIVAIPTMLVVGRDGKVVALGHRVDELRDDIEKLLAAE